MTIPFFSLERQNAALRAEALTAIGDVLDGAGFANGPAVARFENELASYLGVRRVVAVNSGTSALHAALLCAGVRAGDEVITVPLTWISTAWAISYVGATPVFVDVEERTCGMDPAQIGRALTPRTRAIVPVHLYGQPVDLDPILDTARKKGLPVVEDCAQALGADYGGRRAGTFGQVNATSFYPGKNLGAFGEGGAVLTDDDQAADRVQRLRDHAQERRHHHTELGFNWRMDGIQGAILALKLRHLDGWNARRRTIAARYAEGLRETPGLTLLPGLSDSTPIWHVFPVFHPRRDDLRQALEQRGILTAVHYPTPVHLQPAYAGLGVGRGSLPVSERLAETELSLPMFPELTDAEAATVITAVGEECRKLR